MTNPKIEVDIAEILKDLQTGQKELLKEISELKEQVNKEISELKEQVNNRFQKIEIGQEEIKGEIKGEQVKYVNTSELICR